MRIASQQKNLLPFFPSDPVNDDVGDEADKSSSDAAILQQLCNLLDCSWEQLVSVVTELKTDLELVILRATSPPSPVSLSTLEDSVSVSDEDSLSSEEGAPDPDSVPVTKPSGSGAFFFFPCRTSRPYS